MGSAVRTYLLAQGSDDTAAVWTGKGMTCSTNVIYLIGILDITAVHVISGLGNGIFASPDDLAFLLGPEFILE